VYNKLKALIKELTMSKETYKEVYDEIVKLPIFDAHTHVDAAHLSARGLHDILLYHMVGTELYSVGCPDGARLSEDPDDREIDSRLERAMPYVQYL
jgi:hypothetical protein